MSPKDKIHIRPSKELQEKFKEQGERYDVFYGMRIGRDNTFRYVFSKGKLVQMKDISYENETA